MTNDMTKGSPIKLIIQFMIPMCLGNIFQQFYNIADSIIAGQFLGVDALAAIGSTGFDFSGDRVAKWTDKRFFCVGSAMVRGQKDR